VRQDWLQKPTSWGRQRAYLAMFVPRTAHPVTWVAAALGMSRKLKTDRVLSQVVSQSWLRIRSGVISSLNQEPNPAVSGRRRR
jgi:hypothetical protein